jgi:hypothetical protein
MAAYRACLAGERVAVHGKRKASRGTVTWLVGLYRLSRSWTHDLEPATRKAQELGGEARDAASSQPHAHHGEANV